MLSSLRMFSRALPKAAVRQPTVRNISSISRLATRRPLLRPTLKTSYPAFSTSIARREPAGDSDPELAAMLNKERLLEDENTDHNKVALIDDFLQNSPWNVQDEPGTHEIILTRDFGNEKIKIRMSVSDLNEDYPSEDDFDPMEVDEAEDAALGDEVEFGTGKRGINQPGGKAGKINIAPEDSIAPSDEGYEADADDEATASSINLAITITKPGKALEIAAVAADGTIEIEGLTYFPKESLADPQGSKEAIEARGVYAGPQVATLEHDLQSLLETYLRERGIDDRLANFLPNYVEYKEQKEYVRWLENLENFVNE